MIDAKTQYLNAVFAACPRCPECGKGILKHKAVPLGGVGWAVRCLSKKAETPRSQVRFRSDPRTPMRLQVAL